MRSAPEIAPSYLAWRGHTTRCLLGPPQLGLHIVLQLPPKAVRAEPQRVFPAGVRRDLVPVLLELFEAIEKGFDGLMAEQDSGGFRMVQADYGLSYSSSGIGDDRRAAGLRLEWCDPEVLLRRKDKGPRALEPVSQNLKGLMTHELNVCRAPRAHPARLRAVSDHHQPSIGQGGESLNDQVHPLVGDHARRCYVKIVPGRARRKSLDVYRRIDYHRVPTIGLHYPSGDKVRHRHEPIHPIGCASIPDAKPVQEITGDR